MTVTVSSLTCSRQVALYDQMRESEGTSHGLIL